MYVRINESVRYDIKTRCITLASSNGSISFRSPPITYSSSSESSKNQKSTPENAKAYFSCSENARWAEQLSQTAQLLPTWRTVPYASTPSQSIGGSWLRAGIHFTWSAGKRFLPTIKMPRVLSVTVKYRSFSMFTAWIWHQAVATTVAVMKEQKGFRRRHPVMSNAVGSL